MCLLKVARAVKSEVGVFLWLPCTYFDDRLLGIVDVHLQEQVALVTVVPWPKPQMYCPLFSIVSHDCAPANKVYEANNSKKANVFFFIFITSQPLQ